MTVQNKKAKKALDNLLSRQDYLVTQGNELAKAFGGLKAFEQKLLDYCFSYVRREDAPNEIYETTALELIKHFGLNTSGQNYERIGKAFKTLNENTALYLPTVDEDGVRGIIMTQLFSRINFKEDGHIQFKFSEDAAPLVFDLKDHFYSFHLRELSQIKGKYSLILLKLWEARRNGSETKTTIDDDMENWQSWFLGKERRISSGQFYQQVLSNAINELEEKLDVEFYVTQWKRGRKVTGYKLEIVDTSKLIGDGK